MKLRVRSVVLLTVLGLLCLPGFAGTLLVNQLNPYLGYGYGLYRWPGMTSALQGAFGAGNITVSGTTLDAGPSLGGFDALWITMRQQASTLTAAEIAALQAFIGTGRRVVLIGENDGWTAWNNSILGAVGGSFGGETNGSSTPVLTHALTAGVSSVNWTADGLALGGTSLFTANVATLWGGSQNVLSVLSVNVVDEDGWSGGNAVFGTNIANWLAGTGGGDGGGAIPEPSTFVLAGAGLALAALAVRRRRRA